MRFIDQQQGAVSIFQFHDFCQGCGITQHAEHALGDNQAVLRHVAETLQALFQAFDVIVPEAVNSGAAHLAAVIQAGVAVGVEQNRVAGFHQRGQGTQVRRVSG